MRKKGMAGEELIPLEKSKRVIHVGERGRDYGKTKAYPAIAAFFAVTGVLSIIYCLAILIFGGFGSLFFAVWGVLGVACLILAVILSNRKILNKIPKWFKIMFWSLSGAGVLLFCVVEGMICSQFAATPAPGADYCIVLGAQWKSTGPSAVLRKRLEAAIEYLNENPETRVIVSGGQGNNEIISEAAGMQDYLVNAGIDVSKIIMEDASTNTYENLIYSAEFLDEEKDSVVIVTNNFHTFRALSIAKKQGYVNAEGLSADSVTGFLPNNMLREFVGIVKDFIFGNL